MKKRYVLQRTWLNKAIAVALFTKALATVVQTEKMLATFEKLFDGYKHEWQVFAGYTSYSLSVIGLMALMVVCVWWVLGDKDWWCGWR